MPTWVILDEWGNRGTRKLKKTWDRLKLSQHAMIVEVGGVIDDLYVSLTSRTIDNTTTNYSTKFTLAELLLEDPLPEKLETLLVYEWIECRSSSKWLPRNWALYIGKRRNYQWLCSIVEVQWGSSPLFPPSSLTGYRWHTAGVKLWWINIFSWKG